MTQKVRFDAELERLLKRFIVLANEMQGEGNSIELVNAALMMASCTYATYAAAGNDGYLEEGGVNKVAAVFKRNLSCLQQLKKSQLNPEAKN